MKFKLPIYYDVADGGGGGSELDEDLRDLADAPDDDTPADSDSDADPVEGEEEEADPADEGAEGEEEVDEEEDPDAEEEPAEEAEGTEEGEGDGKTLSIKALKKDYPDIFKKHPEVRTAIFRNNQFSEHFADPKEAAAAVVKAEEFDRFNDSISKGDPTLILNELSENNPRALAGFVTKLMPKLQILDKDLYIKAATPILEEAVNLLYNAGVKNKDRNQQLAAKHIANFLFGSADIPEIKGVAREEDNPAAKELEQERSNWARQRFVEAAEELGNAARVDIVGGLEKIIVARYPDLPKYMVKKMAEDTRNSIDGTLMKDEGFQKQLKQLWDRAKKDSYSRQSKAQIKTAFLARAQTVRIFHLNRILKDALGSDYKPVKAGAAPEGTPRKKQLTSSGAGHQHRRPVLDPSKIDYNRTSDADILSDEPARVRLKK